MGVVDTGPGVGGGSGWNSASVTFSRARAVNEPGCVCGYTHDTSNLQACSLCGVRYQRACVTMLRDLCFLCIAKDAEAFLEVCMCRLFCCCCRCNGGRLAASCWLLDFLSMRRLSLTTRMIAMSAREF